MKACILSLLSAFIWLSTITVVCAQDNLPEVRRYYCVSQETSSFIDYVNNIPPSDDPLFGGCTTGVGLTLEYDDAYPDFPDGQPFVDNGYSISRINDGLVDLQIDLQWTPGWTGTVKLTAYYQKREPKNLGIGGCKNDGGAVYLAHYVITRGSLTLDGELEGPSVLSSEDGMSTIDLSYAPSVDRDISQYRMTVYVSYNGRTPRVAAITAPVNNRFTFSESVSNGFGEYAVTTEIRDDCGNKTTGPAKIINVRPSCYEDPPPTLSISGPNLQAYNEGIQVEADQVYTITAQNSTDFDAHFSLEDDGGEGLDLYQEDGTWKFKITDQLGSYRIIPKTDEVRATYCAAPEPVSIFVGGRDITIAQPCPVILPKDLNVEFGYRPEDDPDSLILKHFAATVRSQVQVVVQPGIVLESGAELILDYTPTDDTTPSDDAYHFVNTQRYNDYGEVVAEGRVYLDGSGRSLQRQAKNLDKGVVLATATVYDQYGRPTVQTLPAPVSALPQAEALGDCPQPPYTDQALTFGYAEQWVSDESGEPITKARPLNANGVDRMKVGTQEASLGWYYSEQNGTTTSANVRRMQETGVPITGTPYTRVHYDDDGEVRSVSQPGDEFRLGGKHVAEQDKAPVADGDPYLAAYFAMRSELSLPSVSTFAGRFFMRTARGVDGKRSQVYYDRAGRSLVQLYFGEQTTPITTSYSFYDHVGRLVAVIAPKGVQQYAGGTAFADVEKTRYFYNNKGQLTAMEEPEAGRTEYLYRRDGQIRFSQNAIQREQATFSYTHYDPLARPVESGEHWGAPAFGSSAMLSLLENTQPDGGFSEEQRQDWQRTYYDEVSPAVPDGRTPTFVRGRIAYQEFSAGSAGLPTVTTHYSYDERGRLTWTLKDIVGLGVKTIDYTYAPDGNLRSVAYQRDEPTEAFFHYYAYNGNTRLQQVYTSKKAPRYNARQEITNLSDFTLQGSYEYYLHGPRKRTELGKYLQGLDYTYTAQGWLKSINHADPTADPGQDGAGSGMRPDVFGTTLHYFDGDFRGTALNTPDVLVPNSPQQYSGNLKAASWHNANEPGTVRSYAYRYDERDQLTKADFGTIGTEDVATHRVKLEGYDAHGNLGQLIRKGGVGQNLAKYTYQYAGNQLEQIKQGNKTLMTYEHNALGQLEEKTEEGQTAYYTYDAFRRMVGVYADEARRQAVATFSYDERGNRLSKTAYDASGQASFTTWYVHDAAGRLMSLYADNEQDDTPPAPYEVPVYGAGRLGQYRVLEQTYYHEVQDHLGSVRAVIGGQDTAFFLATAETERQAEEEEYFSSLKRVTVADHLNHTPESVVSNANQAIRINNDQDGVKQPVGASLMRQVYPGDTLRAEVFAKYEYFASASSPLAALSTYLATAFGLPAVGEGAFLSAGDAPLASLMAAATAGAPEDLPQAGLGYLLFDNNLKLIDQGYAPVSTAARVPQDAGALSSHPFERLALNEIVVEKTGFIYLFIANYDKKNVSVFFDDFQVAHQTTDVVYAADYYPHGQEMDGRVLQQKSYRYGYQGAFAEQDEETQLSSFYLRQYDNRIGRWTTPDPYNQYWSPYVGMGNAPNMMIDPDGGLAGGGGPSFWTRLKAFVTGGTISNSGRFVFNTGQKVAGRALATQALKTAGTLAYANAGRLSESGLSNSLNNSWKGGYDPATGRWGDITITQDDGTEKVFKPLTKNDIINRFGGDGGDGLEFLISQAYGKSKNTKVTVGGRVPDFIEDAVLAMGNGRSMRVKRGSIYEATVESQVNLQGRKGAQMRTYVDFLSELNSSYKTDISSLWIITSGEGKVSGSLLKYAANRGVNVFHTVPYIDPSNGIIYFAQWQGVSPTMGTFRYNMLYGKRGVSPTVWSSLPVK